MAILKVAQIGHPILRQPARLVTRDELHTQSFQHFIDSMIETMHDASGAGLAANQVHSAVQVCVMEVNDNPRYPYKPKIPLTVLINPVIEALDEDEEGAWEGCLSVPGLRGWVPRWSRLRYTGFDEFGNAIDRIASGFHARVVQHECDHLDGVLYPMRVRDFSRFGYTEVLFPEGSMAADD